MDPVTDFANVLDEVGRLIGSVTPQQWPAPTPCDEWDVRALVDHLLDLQQRFLANITGEPIRPDASYQDNAAMLTAAFGQSGALDRIIPDRLGDITGLTAMNILTTEFLGHGWDLAHALGTTPSFDDAVASRMIGFARALAPKVPPELQRFKGPQPVPDSAPAIDQLAALLGRTVAA